MTFEKSKQKDVFEKGLFLPMFNHTVEAESTDLCRSVAGCSQQPITVTVFVCSQTLQETITMNLRYGVK